MDEPGTRIDPFPTPTWFSFGQGGGASSLDFTVVFPAIFAIVFFLWVAYTLIVAYHWFRYGHRSFLAVPLLSVHVIVSGTLMLIATAGLR